MLVSDIREIRILLFLFPWLANDEKQLVLIFILHSQGYFWDAGFEGYHPDICLVDILIDKEKK